MISLKKYFLFFTVSLLFASCKAPVQERQEDNTAIYKRSFVETNRYIRERNREYIMAFLNRTGWEMTETPTGLWMMILESGDGKVIEKDEVITYSYETRLINGTLCYSADTIKPKKIVVGKGNVEAGLEEGFLKLKEHSKARFILPPYLGHGNFGDGDKIPGSAILIIDVYIMSVNR